MKKLHQKLPIILWFLFLTILLFLSSSCKSVKTPLSETKTELKNDSLVQKIEVREQVEISKPIYDTIYKTIPVIVTGNSNCDSVCNSRMNEILEQLNFYKKSGENEYKIWYNKNKRLLEINAKLQQQINTKKDSTNTIKKIKEVIKENKVIVPQKYIPKWIQILAGFGVAFILFLVWRFSKIFM